MTRPGPADPTPPGADEAPYTVFVDDNFHSMDESHRCVEGRFTTAEEALAAARRIVDGWLARLHEPGMPADELYRLWAGLGEDPFVRPWEPATQFSAREYAKERCAEICGEG